MPYDIKTHIHLFASWAASRAASVKNNRFKVKIGQAILNDSAIKEYIQKPDQLPSNQFEFNDAHRKWREEIINLANDLNLNFTHGVSAKLINVYLKSVIVCGGFYAHEKSKFVHPPIDSALLLKLSVQDFNDQASFWRRSNRLRWSKFTSDQYEEVINQINIGLKGVHYRR